MDAVKFIEERDRMCKSFGDRCKGCPALGVGEDKLCCAVEKESTLDAMAQVAIVEKWSAAHPRKTRQSVFLEQYSNAKHIDGILAFCPKMIDTNLYCPISDNIDCPKCRREFWMQEVE